MQYRTNHGYTYTDWTLLDPKPEPQEVVDMLHSAEASGYDITFHDPDTGVRFGYRGLAPRPFWINQPSITGEPGVVRYGFGTEFWDRVRRYMTTGHTLAE